jgi:2-(acetamidomethylene)succinate hydrolase
MAEVPRKFREKDVTLPNGLKIHYYEWPGRGVAVKYDSVRVALGLAHMADNLRAYAAKVTCPVAILRGSRGSELTTEEAAEIARCWKNAVVIDVEGDYAMQMENPVGLAQALANFAAQAVKD